MQLCVSASMRESVDIIFRWVINNMMLAPSARSSNLTTMHDDDVGTDGSNHDSFASSCSCSCMLDAECLPCAQCSNMRNSCTFIIVHTLGSMLLSETMMSSFTVVAIALASHACQCQFCWHLYRAIKDNRATLPVIKVALAGLGRPVPVYTHSALVDFKVHMLAAYTMSDLKTPSVLYNFLLHTQSLWRTTKHGDIVSILSTLCAVAMS